MQMNRHKAFHPRCPNACRNKVAFSSEAMATIVLNDTTARQDCIEPERLHVYQCEHCRWWRIGHAIKKMT